MMRAERARLAFRAVNRPGSADYDPGLQRHHLMPCELLGRRAFASLFEMVGASALGFHDFRRNGILLPARADAARRLGLPLHRGPHRRYNAMVSARVGQIEGQWSRRRRRAPGAAGEEALFRLALLQQALRRRLLQPPGKRFVLNRHDPLGAGFDFTELDAMAETLWGSTQAVFAESSAFAS